MDATGFELYLLQEKKLTPSTIKRYLTLWRVLETQTDLSIDQIRAFLLGKIKTISPAGYNKYVIILRHFFAFTGREVPSFVQLMRETPRQRQLLTDDEITAVIGIDPPPSKYGLFWKLMAFTGQRTYEIAQLRREDIDLTRNCIYILDTKRGKTRDIPIHEGIYADLTTYLSRLSTDYLFPTRTNFTTHIQNVDINKNLRYRLRLAEISKDVKPYSIRHSFISNSLDEGAQLLDIMDIVGHSNPNTTLKYKRSNLKGKRKALQYLPLGNKFLTPLAIFSKFIEHVSSFHLSPEYFLVATSRTESSFSLSVTLKNHKE